MELVNLSVKVPPAIRKKLKMYCAYKDKSLTDVFTDFVDRLNLGFDIPGITDEKKPAKRHKTKPKTITTGTPAKRKDMNPEADEELIKAEILKHREKKLSYGKIAVRLESDGIPTLRGGKWAKGTVGRLVKRWEAEAQEQQG